jgi:hypothetical protein
MKNKKAEITSQEIVSFIIGAAIFFVLIVLWFKLFAPSVSIEEQSAESLFNSFKKQISILESRGKAVFLMSPGQSELYLIYFGYKDYVSFEGIEFKVSQVGENMFCMCYVMDKEDKEGVCNKKYCLSLKTELDNSPVLKSGQRLIMEETENKYFFEVI